MRIKYINGRRLHTAFLAGGNAVLGDKDYLNKINVFPVPDGDTGTNLAATMMSIAEGSVASASLRSTLRSIADAALTGARGNSGLIFAQFIHGISREIRNDIRLTTKTFGESVKAAVQYLHRAIVSPKEGTMLTVIRDWADAVYCHRTKTADFAELLNSSLQVAQKSLDDTPKKLSVLAKAGVVDAGAKGFVDFIEGIIDFITRGKLRAISEAKIDWQVPDANGHSLKSEIKHRYCTEALMTGDRLDIDRLRSHVDSYGDSAIVAGSEEKVRFHVHTNRPADLFFELKDFGTVTQVKADDMLKQYEASHNRKAPIALVTDTSCDLPQDILDEHQIHVVPFQISFDDHLFLDKITLTPEQFYTMLKTHPVYPKTSQPTAASIMAMLSFLTTIYDSVIVYNISGALSGTFDSSRQAAARFRNKKISVIDSRSLSMPLGLIVLRAAKAIREGKSHDDIVKASGEWINKTKLFVDIQTLKYLVRGGRVSPMKGLLAKILHLKPIITLNDEGRAVMLEKSFSRRGNMMKILRKAERMGREKGIWGYGIVHVENLDRARLYGKKLKELLCREPAFIMDVSPVIGVHAGIGAVGIALLGE